MSAQSVQNKPTAAFVLSLVAGILGMVSAFALIVVAAAIGPIRTYSYYYSYSYTYNYALVYILGGVGIWVLIASILQLIGGIKLNSNPLEHTKWGVIILVFSIIGGINIFGIIGGALALTYRPITYSQTAAPPQVTTRFCPQCGQAMDEKTNFCPYCGKQLT